jgi:hypothetical protein
VGFVLTLATFLITQTPTFGQETTTAPLKVLFIGNSYTFVNDLPAMIAGLADAAGGRKIEVDRHLVGGCTLERHVKEREASDKIRAEKWDVVVLQEQSLRPVIDRKSMHKYSRLLDAEIKQQGAKTVFYLTWARQHIPEMQEGADPAESPEYAKAMYEISGAAKTTDLETWCQQQEAGLIGGLNGGYLDIAEELGARVAPVGIAWKMALAADPPFVLHSADKSHPNSTGTYLAACVFYATLLDASPVGLPGKIQQGDKVLADFPDDQAKRLQEIAWAAVRESPRGEATYTNPVGHAPIHMGDPFVIRHDGKYYLFGTIGFMKSLRPRLELDGCYFAHVEPWLDPEDIMDLWFFEGPPEGDGRVTKIFNAVPNRLMFAGHCHSWMLVTPDGIAEWKGDCPIKLDRGRYFVAVGALLEGRYAIFDTETSALVPFNEERLAST